MRFGRHWYKPWYTRPHVGEFAPITTPLFPEFLLWPPPLCSSLNLKLPLASVLAAALLAGGCANKPDGDADMDRSPNKVKMPTTQVKTGDAYAFGPVSVARTATTPQARGGQAYSYTLTVANNSDAMLHNVRVVEAVTGGFNIRSAESGGESIPIRDADSGAVSAEVREALGATVASEGEPNAITPYVLPIGVLGPNQQVQVTITGLPSEGDSFQTCTYVDYVPSICTDIEIVRPQWAFALQVTDAEGNPVSQAYACDPLYVRYFVSNTGEIATDPITISQTLPEGFTTRDGKREIEMTTRALQPEGEDARLQMVGEPMLVQASGPGTFYTTAEASDGSLTAEDDSNRVTISTAELALTVDGPRAINLNGGDPIYTVSVSNPGDVPALDTAVAVALPQNSGRNVRVLDTQRVSYDDGRFVVGDLAPGETADFRFAFTPTANTDIALAAEATAYCAQAVSQDITTRILSAPAFQIEVIDSAEPVAVGDNVEYFIEVINEGNASTNMQLSAELPQGMTFVSGTGSTNVTSKGQTVNFGPIADFAPDAESPARWTVVVKAETQGNKQFTVTLNSKDLDNAVTETEPTNVVAAVDQTNVTDPAGE